MHEDIRNEHDNTQKQTLLRIHELKAKLSQAAECKEREILQTPKLLQQYTDEMKAKFEIEKQEALDQLKAEAQREI